MSGVGNWFTSHVYSICVGLYVHMSSRIYMCSVTHSCLFVIPWTVAHQAPLSMGVPRQKNTAVGWHFLPQGIFLTEGLNPSLLHWQADSLPLSHLASPCIHTTKLTWVRKVTYQKEKEKLYKRLMLSHIKRKYHQRWQTLGANNEFKKENLNSLQNCRYRVSKWYVISLARIFFDSSHRSNYGIYS